MFNNISGEFYHYYTNFFFFFYKILIARFEIVLQIRSYRQFPTACEQRQW